MLWLNRSCIHIKMVTPVEVRTPTWGPRQMGKCSVGHPFQRFYFPQGQRTHPDRFPDLELGKDHPVPNS